MAAIFPTINEFGRFTSWIVTLVTRPNDYGAGYERTKTLTEIFRSFYHIYKGEHLLSTTLFILILTGISQTLYLVYKKQHIEPKITALGAGLIFLVFILNFAFSAFQFSKAYIYSIGAIVPLLALWVSQLYSKEYGLNNSNNGVLAIFCIIFSIIFLQKTTDAITKYIINLKLMADAERQTNLLIQEYITYTQLPAESIIVLYTYRTPDKCYALWYGRNYIDLPTDNILQAKCINHYQYNGRLKTAYINRKWYRIDEIDFDILVTRSGKIFVDEHIKDRAILYDKYEFEPHIYVFVKKHP